MIVPEDFVPTKLSFGIENISSNGIVRHTSSIPIHLERFAQGLLVTVLWDVMNTEQLLTLPASLAHQEAFVSGMHLPITEADREIIPPDQAEVATALARLTLAVVLEQASATGSASSAR